MSCLATVASVRPNEIKMKTFENEAFNHDRDEIDWHTTQRLPVSPKSNANHKNQDI